MSEYRRQALIDCPVERVWELVGDPRRHPEWWPRVVDVNGIEEPVSDVEFVQTTRRYGGQVRTTTMKIEELEDLRQIHLRCLDTGTFANWHLTEAQGSTFAELEMGMDPESMPLRVFDRLLGKRFYGEWSEQALEGLQRAAAPGEEEPGPA
jgi:uncharacterized protein YndB with AHSA1/START domain